MAMKRGALAMALWLAVGLAAEPAAAEWRETHKRGVEAIAAKRWSDAEELFRSAIGERSTERVNRFLNVAYVPHYYLGVALAEQGRCSAAIASWDESLRQDQIKRSAKLLPDLERRMAECRDTLSQVETATGEVERLLARVQATAADLSDLAKTTELAPLWEEGSPSLNALEQRASQKLASAKTKFEQGKRQAQLDVLDTAKTLTNQAQEDFETAIAMARQRRAELNAATGEAALQKLEQAEISARRILRSIADLAPYPRRLGGRVNEVQDLLQKVVDSKAGADAAALDQLTDELTVSLANLRRAARRPPEQLRQAAEAFFATRFEEVLELTSDEKLTRDRRAKAHVCLLRAASHHALWVLTGEQDETGRETIASEILACAELDSPLAPDPKYYSPRFVALHSQILDEAAAAAVAEAEAEAEAAGGQESEGREAAARSVD
ncbi:MAG: hypothetical protein AAF560_00480 [Acidobacteriota bacterium]